MPSCAIHELSGQTSAPQSQRLAYRFTVNSAARGDFTISSTSVQLEAAVTVRRGILSFYETRKEAERAALERKKLVGIEEILKMTGATP
jgi:hypothetical protein